MQETEVIPELKQIIGAMLFAAKHPVSSGDIRRVFKQVAETRSGPAKDFGKVTEGQVKEAMETFKQDLEKAKIGIHVAEIANGYRLQNDASCGPWLRELLEKGRPSRLSKPALETLAIIAYRQPCSRQEIEAVRGVAVDNIIRNLLEMQLIRAVGRSDLPGRPWLFGTTQAFLEHFGLRNLDDLPGVDELRRLEMEKTAVTANAGDEPTVVPEDDDEDDEEEDDEIEDDEGDEDDDDS